MKHILLFLFALCILPAVLCAQDMNDYTKVQLISATTGTGDARELSMALEISLKDQWYTYWRMPGDNGVAPILNWDGSTNVKEVSMSWPIPKRFTLQSMHSFGYDGTTLFPLRVAVNEPGKDVVLKLKLDLMICHDICIPQTVTLERKFSAGEALPSEYAPRIDAANAALPKAETESLKINSAILGKDAVVITVFSQTVLTDEVDLIVETPRALLTAPPELIPGEEGTYILKIKGPPGVDLTDELFGKKVTMLLIHQDQAIEKEINF